MYIATSQRVPHSQCAHVLATAGMGYNERQYSLPRIQDLSISRQSVYDDTYNHIPTVGWMFVPLVVYHGGRCKPAQCCIL